MTTVTPIKSPPLNDLRQAIEMCVCYEDVKNVSAESAQQQIPRIRHLILRALASLGEPNEVTVDAVKRVLGGIAVEVTDREARDISAVVTHHALTWGLGDDVEAMADATGCP